MHYQKYLDDANEIFSKAFVFLNDESFQRISNALENTKTFYDLRLNLLTAMRQSIHPDTKFSAQENLHDINY
jgi:hypothetical protein